MPHAIDRLFANNQAWITRKTAQDPDYFGRLSRQQAPDFLWIGCSDSRVPANDIVGLDPGELFVHRNVANQAVPSDLNLLSVLQFAIEMLSVRHVIVCGHYGCGGVKAALGRQELGLSDNWLQPIKQIWMRNREALQSLSEDEQLARLCELNVRHQVTNVAATTLVQEAWARGDLLHVHGWIYALDDGRLRDLGCKVTGPEGLDPALRLKVPAGRLRSR